MQVNSSVNMGNIYGSTITIGDSTFIDREKAQWAKDTNTFGAKFYTAEEMHRMQMETIMENEAKLPKMTDPYEEIYKKTHPDYKGEKIFCEYIGGPLYDANEMVQKMWKNYLTQNHLTQADADAQRARWRKNAGYPE